MRFWLLLLLVIFTAYFAMQRKIHPQLSFNSVADRLQHPLDTRLRYRIGEVDSRFNISHEELIQLSQQATDVWLLGTQKQFFVYDPNASLKINLIYDQRQAESQARILEMGKIENSKLSIEQERTKLKELKSQLDYYEREIDLLKTSYKAKVDVYNEWVKSTNEMRQGNNPTTIQQLQYQKQLLENEQDRIQRQINVFNENVARLNQQVDVVNSISSQINHSVDQFNSRFQARQFDKGQFNGREINIYEFHSKDDLRITLAHEFGHALGILHTNDPESLMFPIMEKQDLVNFRLKPADIELLNSRN